MMHCYEIRGKTSNVIYKKQINESMGPIVYSINETVGNTDKGVDSKNCGGSRAKHGPPF